MSEPDPETPSKSLGSHTPLPNVADDTDGSTEGESLVDKCKNCGTTAPADATGLCSNPKCRAVRKGAKLAAKYGPINKRRRKELRERFIRDYRPATTIDEIRCRELADIAERLEVVKKGTMDHQRLILTTVSLTTSLEESIRVRASSRTDDAAAVADLTKDELVQRLVAMLEDAVELRDNKRQAEQHQAEQHQAEQHQAEQPIDVVVADGVLPSDAKAVMPAEPEPCRFCYQPSPDACAALKTTRPVVWSVLHANDPIEVERREAEARERTLDELDALEFLATGRVTAHMRERQAARERPMSDEEKQQAELRKKLGWSEGIMSEQRGYRRRE